MIPNQTHLFYKLKAENKNSSYCIFQKNVFKILINEQYKFKKVNLK